MSKVVMRYIGEENYIAGLTPGQLIEVEPPTDGSIYCIWINRHHEEMYLPPNKVLPYEQ